MMGFGEARVEALVPTDALQPMVERVLIALPVGELDAGIRPDGVDLVGHGGDAGAPAWCRHGLAGLSGQLGSGKLARAVDGHEQRALACFHADLGSSAVAVV
jgi:hypothetical protein